MRVRDDVTTHGIAWNYDEPISLHVVDAEGATVLFGTGPPESTDAVVALARDRGVDVAVAEHGDPDHVGGAARLRDELGVEVAIPAGDAGALEAEGVDPDHRLDAGRTYWGIETIAAPGHTKDNMAYLYGDVLVAGDTVMGSDSVHAADGDWTGPLAVAPPSYNPDDELMRESVAGLLDHDFETVLVSHGGNVMEGGYEAVETLARDLGVA